MKETLFGTNFNMDSPVYLGKLAGDTNIGESMSQLTSSILFPQWTERGKKSFPLHPNLGARCIPARGFPHLAISRMRDGGGNKRGVVWHVDRTVLTADPLQDGINRLLRPFLGAPAKGVVACR